MRGRTGRDAPRVRRQFTREYKLEAVRLAADAQRAGAKSLTEVARELGIRPDMLRAWRRQARGSGAAPAAEVFPGNGKLTSQDEELRRLRREVAQLREERELLKKAAAFFARESR